MENKKSIIWSYTKGEFVVFDHYYFSKLYNFLLNNYNLYIPTAFDDIFNYNFDMLVFNYPEKEFENYEISKILDLFYKGKLILFLSYYNNEDNSSQICNGVLNQVGININYDEVIDKINNIDNDEYLLVTSKVSDLLNKGVNKILLPCSSSISVIKKINDLDYLDLVLSENGETLVKGVFNTSGGGILAFGTCVFWDNFSLLKLDNMNFVDNLFSLVNLNKGGLYGRSQDFVR